MNTAVQQLSEIKRTDLKPNDLGESARTVRVGEALLVPAETVDTVKNGTGTQPSSPRTSSRKASRSYW